MILDYTCKIGFVKETKDSSRGSLNTQVERGISTDISGQELLEVEGKRRWLEMIVA